MCAAIASTATVEVAALFGLPGCSARGLQGNNREFSSAARELLGKVAL